MTSTAMFATLSGVAHWPSASSSRAPRPPEEFEAAAALAVAAVPHGTVDDWDILMQKKMVTTRKPRSRM